MSFGIIRKTVAAVAAAAVSFAPVAFAASRWNAFMNKSEQMLPMEDECGFSYTETVGHRAGDQLSFFRFMSSDTLQISIVYAQPRSDPSRRPSIDIMAVNRRWRPRLVAWHATYATFVFDNPAGVFQALEQAPVLNIHEAARDGHPHGDDWLVNVEGLGTVLASYGECLGHFSPLEAAQRPPGDG
jgi:hypothetical protein